MEVSVLNFGSLGLDGYYLLIGPIVAESKQKIERKQCGHLVRLAEEVPQVLASPA